MSENPFASDANPFLHQNEGANEPVASSPSLTGGSGVTLNPTFEGQSANPFYNQGVATVPVVQESPAKQEPNNFGFGAATTPAGPAGGKEEALIRKERELERKAESLRRREETLQASGGELRVKNFPKFFPLVYHNIDADIPFEKQRVVRAAFYSYLGLVICLLWNWFAVTCNFFVEGGDETSAWLYNGIYLVTGTIGSWFLWYSRLYSACKGDRALTFFFFFITYSVHVAFCIWATIAPPGFLGEDHAFTGIFAMVDVFQDSGFVGFLFMIGMFLWGFETLLSFYVMRAAYKMFRGTGHNTTTVTQDAVRQGYGNLV
mmetsp:Transcript_40057/g.55657  ORF Transcript_40057/g.55657 Transcript_40057/m.55657 type:complete len:318 (+) Transcript_40057:117-1070(+)|eukprot:CAMPEP_0196583300 /NCGR_PEP_ID=MMETSP1081-20130531/42896_1 /TAXON_ID=36882 /ORGANISM="Pyramimonas amylifera, Strain CCMP720" /LENGTH=317 /DNA_ID=CAMNT_0041904135 /DNA_START=112 /DNA_END=1068 /DNA_ORIENTATION=+